MENLHEESIVFRDDFWAAEIGPGMEIPGWFLLRTRRHVELATGLNDSEAHTLGRRIRSLVTAVAEVTGAPAVYQMVFGENHRHFHVVIAARGEHVAADRRSGDILKLLGEGHKDPDTSQALLPRVRVAYQRISNLHSQLDAVQ